MFNRIAFLILTTLFFNGQVYLQSFPNDKQKFIKYVDQLFSENESEKVRSFVSDQLKENILKIGTIDNVTFDQIVSTCNNLEQNKLKPYPDIFNYLYTINYLYTSKISNDKIENWHEIVDQLIESKNKYTDDFLKFTLQFFLYNKIADAGNSKWYYKSGDYFFYIENNPLISLKDGTLKCLLTDKSSGSTAQDSIVIASTNGVMDIVTKSWQGSKGALTWTKTGIDSKDMFASFQSNYKLNLKSSELKLDSILLTAPYFKKPIYGTIEDKTNTYLRDIDRIYPRFYSYDKRVKVENIMDGIDYDGGFLIEGNSLIGSGDKENPSKVIVNKDNLPFIIVSSELFQFTVNSIQSSQSRLRINLIGDSISHNNINFSYNKLSKEVEISRPSKGRGNAPFENTYHMLDMYIQRILYKPGTDQLKFTYDYGASVDLRNAKFESKNYFNEKLFDSFKGQDAVNPLINAAKYSREKNLLTMTEGEFANALNKFLTQCKSLMLEMASHGFINYDVEGKVVSINDKLFRYVDFKSGLRDFDHISFTSDLKPEILEFSMEELDQIKSNPQLQKKHKQLLENENRRKSLGIYGMLNLKSKELIIDGVDYVSISNSQPTYVSPNNLMITVKKNRDMTFNGSIFSGKIEIENELGSYNYASNSFDIKNAKRSVFTVVPFTEKDREIKSIEMISNLTNLNGTLLVDDTSNRSGRKTEFIDFPKLIVKKPCKIFYNDILNGAYDSTRFFVVVEPFEIDSLDNFKEKSLSLNGELTSAGIFPKLKEKIKIMDDYSFGFSTKAPDEGYQFYGGNTSYKNKIILSANGLQGAGTINFMNSVSDSKALTFLPDSTIGIANFVNKPSEDKIEFPDVYNERSFICYIPKSRILKASSTNDNPMRLFNNEAHLGGTIVLKETGMNGLGELGFKTATMYSNNYKFTRWDIVSDTSSFYLKNSFRDQGDDPLALKADGVSAKISFKTRIGEFNATNTKEINLPANLYYCLMDKFFWYMDGSTIDMEKNKDGLTSFETDATGLNPNFYCYDPKFDDPHKIKFKALNARYDLKTQQILCSKVSVFPIGDVNIIPDSNKLTVMKKGQIKPLINAIIETNNKTHFFEQCYVEVADKGTYKANGQYRYSNSDNEVSFIKIENIICSNFRTKASGFIDEKKGFKLSKQFEYFGNIEIISNEDSIYCDGSTRVIHDCKYKKSWYAFKDKIQPKNIQIPIGNTLVNTDEQPLGIGFYWDKEKRNIYTTFLSPTNLPEDELLYAATGYLQFNKSKNEYQISSKKQLKQRDENISVDALSTENYLSLDLQDNSCNMFGEGTVNFGINLGDSKIESYGTLRYDAVNNKKTTLNLSSRIYFPVSQDIMENLAKKIKGTEEMKSAKVSEINQTNFDRAMKHWNTTKDYEKIREAVLNETTPKFPKQLEETIILSGLELISFGKNETKGLKSNTTNALLVSLYEKPVFKFVPIELYIDQQFEETNSDNFGINFKAVDKFYYFDLRMKKNDGNMNIISNDDLFNKPIRDMKPKARKIKNFNFEATDNMEFYDEFKKIF